MMASMKDHPVHPDALAKPRTQIVYLVREVDTRSRISGLSTTLASRRRRLPSIEAFPCARLICRKQHSYFASILKSCDSAPKREPFPGPKSDGAGSSSKTTLSTMSDRSMLLVG